MAPIEFEKQIKERLDERKIKPSAAAWDKIRDKIEIPVSRKKPVFIKYAAAAAIVGILFSVFWMNNNSENESLDNLPIVDNPSELEMEKLNPTDVENVYQPESIELVETKNIEKDPVSAEKQNQNHNLNNQYLALEVENKETLDPVLSLQSDERIDQKIAEVVAHVSFMENNQESITDSEVDSLLRNAQQELLAEKALQSTQDVDAAELLAGVEDELEQSFRDQVFERLKNGYIKVRTAVADRNN